MPESRPRKRQGSTSAASRSAAGPRRSSRWIAPAMCACWVLGLLWIVTYYIAGDRIGLLIELGNWNLVVGMGLVGLGFVFATRWV